jgi:acyl-CoA reductase-like NAD-dependent aldehyde dehydrogenase
MLKEKVDKVIHAAQEAQKPWGKAPLQRRVEIVSHLVEEMRRSSKEAELAIQQEVKKLPDAAKFEMDVAIRKVESLYPHAESALRPKMVSGKLADSVISYEPLGVSVIITPWNFPFSITSALIANSLIAGNSVILKPSELTPRCGEVWQTICNNVFPKNLVQVVSGSGEEASQLISGNIQLVVFVGGITTGQKIMRNIAQDFKRVILELGDKSTLFVLKEADLAKAAEFAAQSCFNNAGQACISTERIIIEQEVFEPFLTLFSEQAEAIVAKIPPLINEKSALLNERQIQQAIQQGANLIKGGKREGCFISPTILTHVSENMDVWQHENFGPIAAIKTSADIEADICKLNADKYGLASVVFCENMQRAQTIAQKINVGMVAINQGVFGHANTPWVGMRASGYGFHGSEDGYKQFAQIKVTHLPKAEEITKVKTKPVDSIVLAYRARSTPPNRLVQQPPLIEGVNAFVDIHCHAYHQEQDPLALAKLASLSHMQGILYKTIATEKGQRPTEAAALLNKALQEWAQEHHVTPICCKAGFIVGGRGAPLSLELVQKELENGVGAIWLPVFNSSHSRTVIGPPPEMTPISKLEAVAHGDPCLLDEEGKLKPFFHEVIALVGKYDNTLFFGHIGKEEIPEVLAAAKNYKVQKMVIDHPFSPFLSLTVEDMRSLATEGVVFNFTYDELSPLIRVPPEKMCHAIQTVGPRHFTLSSDAGGGLFPNSVECMRLITAYMKAYGLSEAEINYCASELPAYLMGLTQERPNF